MEGSGDRLMIPGQECAHDFIQSGNIYYCVKCEIAGTPYVPLPNTVGPVGIYRAT